MIRIVTYNENCLMAGREYTPERGESESYQKTLADVTVNEYHGLHDLLADIRYYEDKYNEYGVRMALTLAEAFRREAGFSDKIDVEVYPSLADARVDRSIIETSALRSGSNETHPIEAIRLPRLLFDSGRDFDGYRDKHVYWTDGKQVIVADGDTVSQIIKEFLRGLK